MHYTHFMKKLVSSLIAVLCTAEVKLCTYKNYDGCIDAVTSGDEFGECLSDTGGTGTVTMTLDSMPFRSTYGSSTILEKACIDGQLLSQTDLPSINFDSSVVLERIPVALESSLLALSTLNPTDHISPTSLTFVEISIPMYYRQSGQNRVAVAGTALSTSTCASAGDCTCLFAWDLIGNAAGIPSTIQTSDVKILWVMAVPPAVDTDPGYTIRSFPSLADCNALTNEYTAMTVTKTALITSVLEITSAGVLNTYEFSNTQDCNPLTATGYSVVLNRNNEAFRANLLCTDVEKKYFPENHTLYSYDSSGTVLVSMTVTPGIMSLEGTCLGSEYTPNGVDVEYIYYKTTGTFLVREHTSTNSTCVTTDSLYNLVNWSGIDVAADEQVQTWYYRLNDTTDTGYTLTRCVYGNPSSETCVDLNAVDRACNSFYGRYIEIKSVCGSSSVPDLVSNFMTLETGDYDLENSEQYGTSPIPVTVSCNSGYTLVDPDYAEYWGNKYTFDIICSSFYSEDTGQLVFDYLPTEPDLLNGIQCVPQCTLSSLTTTLSTFNGANQLTLPNSIISSGRTTWDYQDLVGLQVNCTDGRIATGAAKCYYGGAENTVAWTLSESTEDLDSLCQYESGAKGLSNWVVSLGLALLITIVLSL